MGGGGGRKRLCGTYITSRKPEFTYGRDPRVLDALELLCYIVLSEPYFKHSDTKIG